jgi:hypothetical protein
LKLAASGRASAYHLRKLYMYLTRILSSIVFVVFASTSLAVKPENTLRPGKTIKQDRCTSTESASVVAVNVDPDRDGCKVGSEAQERSTPAPEYSKTQGMNVTSRMAATGGGEHGRLGTLRGGGGAGIKADASEECVER